MHRSFSLLCALILAVGCGNVLGRSLALREVDANGFNRAIKANSVVFVFAFSTPCDQACEQARVTATEAGQQLLGKMLFIEVDISRNPQVRSQLRGVDSLAYYLFRDGEGLMLSPMSSQGLTAKLQKALQPSVVLLDTKPKKTEFVSSAGARVAAFVSSTSSPEYTVLEKVSKRLHPDVTFGVITDAKMAKSLHMRNAPTIQLQRPYEKTLTYPGEMTVQELFQWVDEHKKLTIGELHSDNTYEVFGPSSQSVVILFAQARDVARTKTTLMLHGVAKKIKNDTLQFVIADPDEFGNQWLEQIGVDRARLPAIAIINVQNRGEFVYEGELTADDVEAWLQQYVRGELVKKLKSAPPPETNDGPIRIVTGNTFDDEVIHHDKDVLLEFWAPWCGHCKRLAPIYEQLGEAFADVPGVVIASFNAQDNDPKPSLQVTGFPTLLFFRGNDKENPVPFNGERTFDALVAFIKQHATNPINKEITAPVLLEDAGSGVDHA